MPLKGLGLSCLHFRRVTWSLRKWLPERRHDSCPPSFSVPSLESTEVRLEAKTRGRLRGRACWGLLIPRQQVRPADKQQRRSLKGKVLGFVAPEEVHLSGICLCPWKGAISVQVPTGLQVWNLKRLPNHVHPFGPLWGFPVVRLASVCSV